MDWDIYCNAVYAARLTEADSRTNTLAYLDCLDRLHEAMCEHACNLYGRYNGWLDYAIIEEAESVRESMMFVHRIYERTMRALR